MALVLALALEAPGRPHWCQGLQTQCSFQPMSLGTRCASGRSSMPSTEVQPCVAPRNRPGKKDLGEAGPSPSHWLPPPALLTFSLLSVTTTCVATHTHRPIYLAQSQHPAGTWQHESPYTGETLFELESEGRIRLPQTWFSPS